MRHSSGLPAWFRLLFTVMMLAVCAVVAFCTVERVSLEYQAEDLARSVETSHQREKKQEYEYDQVVTELPQTKAELEEVLPRAEAAQATVTDLKAQRKALREEKENLEAELETAKTEEAEALQQVETLQAEVDALKQQVEELTKQLNP